MSMSEVNLPIVGHTIQQMMLDWDGKIVVTIFLPKCNMDCSFCHSHNLIDPPEDIETEPESETLDLLKKHADFYDGICVTGGEPTLHDLAQFFRKDKDMGMLVKLDTNGTNPARLKQLVNDGLVDYVAMDYKAPKEKMQEVCRGNFSLEKVMESVEFLMSGAVDHEFRTTAVPALHTEEDLRTIIKEISGAQKWVVQRFRGKGIKKELYIRESESWLLENEKWDEGVLENIVEEAKTHFQKVKLRG